MHNCFIQGHESPGYNSRTYEKDPCKYCGKPIEGDGEDPIWERHEWIKYVGMIFLAMLAFTLSIMVCILIATPFFAISCNADGVKMGLETQYNFWAGSCYVNYKDFGWVPFDKLFLLMKP